MHLFARLGVIVLLSAPAAFALAAGCGGTGGPLGPCTTGNGGSPLPKKIPG